MRVIPLNPWPISLHLARLGVVALLMACGSLPATSLGNDGVAVSYNNDIRPLLAEYCFACHGTDEESREAGLRLDQREDAIDFAAILPGDADESEMMVRIRSDDPSSVMPPPETKKALSEAEVRTLVRWINEGAPYESHWSLTPPKQTPPPAVSDPDWIRDPMDQFVLAKLDELGLQPAPDAGPMQLFRRLHLDITGLPPETEKVTRFLDDYEDDPDRAVAAWVDRLMRSPGWGEHRARYWLDAARYADTHGMHFDNYREMWPYRDWVIRAFNDNQPMDRFIVEQLAGDLLPDPTQDQLIATGFNRCNMTTNEGGTIDAENLALYAADRVQTFGWVFLGLTTNCAQCHDHKFDAFSMKDYYSLAAFFRNIEHPPKDGNVKDGRGPTLLLPSQEDLPRYESIPGEIDAAKKAMTALRDSDETQSAFEVWRRSTAPRDVASTLPSEQLRLRLPLDMSESKMAFGLEADDVRLTTTGHLTFASQPDQPFDSALSVSPGNTLAVGDVGQLAWDRPATVSAWIHAESVGGSGTIMAKMDVDAKHRGWDFQVSDGRLQMHLIDSFPESAILVQTKAKWIQAKKWMHVAATYDGSGKAAGVKLFVNGAPRETRINKNTLQINGESPPNLTTSTPLRVGQRSRGENFKGMVRQIRIDEGIAANWQLEVMAKTTTVERLLGMSSPNKNQLSQLRQFHVAVTEPSYAELSERVDSLSAERDAIVARSPMTHIQREKPMMAKTNMLLRGEYDQIGEEVMAATPEAMHPLADDAPRNRLGLAQWVVAPDNPVTARVTVNRFWQELFGRGLVVTSEDFGVTGALPSHPELLDHLTIQFQNDGWDVKAFFRRIFNSSTYRQAAIATPDKIRLDRDNVALSRGPRFRMDAEMIRDQSLAVSGLLSPEMYGPGTRPYQPGNIWEVVGLPGGDTRNYVRGSGSELYRRTIYTFWKRMAPPPNLETFGAPNREVCVVRRERTNTPLQALVTLNDVTYVESARLLATRVIHDAGNDTMDARFDWLAARLLSRDWNPAERSILDESVQAYLEHYQTHPDDADALLSVGETPVDDSIPPAHLAAWTMLCNQTLNLDEVLNK
ncbi:MAG: DUF1553 domain-containing protein [Planctomycetota bacterium]